MALIDQAQASHSAPRITGLVTIGAPPVCGHEGRDVPAQHTDLAHEGRRDEGVLLGRRQEHGLDRELQMAVHRGELELVLEVGHGTQPAEDYGQAVLTHVVDRQPAISVDADVWCVGQRFAGHRDALVEAEHRRLVRAGGNRHHDASEHAGRASGQVDVAIGNGVEGPGIHGA
jgi:hypothetical protein